MNQCRVALRDGLSPEAPAVAYMGSGGFFVEVRGEGEKYPTLHGIMACDSQAKLYTQFYASSAGLVGGGTATVDGNAWTWTLEDKWLGRAFKGRTTVIIKSATQYTAKYEYLDPNGTDVAISEGTATRVAP